MYYYLLVSLCLFSRLEGICMTQRRFTFPKTYYLACHFVIMMPRLRLKFRVTSLNIDCHRGSDCHSNSKLETKSKRHDYKAAR